MDGRKKGLPAAHRRAVHVTEHSRQTRGGVADEADRKRGNKHTEPPRREDPVKVESFDDGSENAAVALAHLADRNLERHQVP